MASQAVMLSLGVFTCLTVVSATKNPVPDSGSQPKAVRVVVDSNGDVKASKPQGQDYKEKAERKVHKKQKHFENLNTEADPNVDGAKSLKMDAALRKSAVRAAPEFRPKPHKTHDSGPHPAPIPKERSWEEPTPMQYDTDPTYCWGDGGVYRWTIATQYKEGDLSPEYEAGLRKNRRAYARKHNYEYCEFKVELIGKEGWDKLAATNALLRRRRGKVLMLDADAIIMNMDIKLEDIEKTWRNNKDIVFSTDVYDPRGYVHMFNSSLTSRAFMVWNGVWSSNFFLDWMLYLQDDDYLANNFTSYGWSDEYHGFMDKEQTGLLALRDKNKPEWDVHVEVVPWNVFSSPYPAPIDTGDKKWASDPTWRFRPGDFILHPHGREGLQKTLYQDLMSTARSCALTGSADAPCRWFENSDNKFTLSFPSYLGMTTEEWADKATKVKAKAIKYGPPVTGVLGVVILSWYLRKKAVSRRDSAS